MALQVQNVKPKLDRHQLHFGMAEKADSGFDLGLDILSPPTPQLPIKLYAYWQIEDVVAPRLLSDYRAESDSAITHINDR